MSRSIPDRWLEYKPYGTVIKGTKILPFKVPLKAALNNNLEPDKRFTTSMLLEAFPRLKFIIDLTNTNRYYDEKEFTKSDIKYEKIMVHGREVPPLDVVKKFFKTMDDFTSACGEDDIIGVHCTHGVNRTGYFICRYLFQQLGWKLKDCLKAFEEARGYPIEREIYVTALKRTPREKLDTSKPTLSTLNMSGKTVMRWSFRQGRPSPYSIEGRRRFAKDGPFSLPHFGYAGPPPGFRPRPSPPHIPPIPPLSGPLPLYGPRPFSYRHYHRHHCPHRLQNRR
ncbi:unnamed protein product [Xylocopa violacea]|uniref:Tyrosine specific protein phosphatases domain-containing protein n=1 Tax=Xylocopa violacea TaxID=135666 RepID=A0ABP1NXI5_XYLVO